MANVKVAWPNFISRTNSTFTTHTFNTSGIKIGSVQMAEEDATITEIGWVLDSKVGTPVGSIRVGLQSVDSTTGLQTGTWLGGTTNYVTYGTSWTSTNVGGISSTLPTSVSLTAGQYYAIMIETDTAFTSTDYITVGYAATTANGSFTNFPYVIDQAGKGPLRRPNFCTRTSTRTYGMPFKALDSLAIDTDIFNEIGHYFILPTGFCSTYKICGVEMFWSPNAVGDSFDVILYEDTNRTALQRVTIDTDNLNLSAGSSYFYFDESTLSTLNAGTAYRIMIKPNFAVTSGTLFRFEVDKAQDMTAYIGTDATCHQTEWSGSAYTDTSTKFFGMNLMICDVDKGASVSSTAANPLGGFVG